MKVRGDDLFNTPLDQSEIDFENAGGETYICGNPPYLGSKWQTSDQKADLEQIFRHCVLEVARLRSGMVRQSRLWHQYTDGFGIRIDQLGMPRCSSPDTVASHLRYWPWYRLRSHVVRWANLASHNAGVTVAIIAIARDETDRGAMIYSIGEDGETTAKSAERICAYLVPGDGIEIKPARRSISGCAY